jgi:hypothetical protein
MKPQPFASEKSHELDLLDITLLRLELDKTNITHVIFCLNCMSGHNSHGHKSTPFTPSNYGGTIPRAHTMMNS